ncbi:AGAP008083-PA-like protein [Anopheles sinensis]|uniref:AGAP008083-PA-like protein n=1 Tax=Anopheles sinensis TaxID=74873 RepID=A0A084VN77_ANOSI|nr:AGAP008083-PA-like protein [Anopheles sinensis]
MNVFPITLSPVGAILRHLPRLPETPNLHTMMSTLAVALASLLALAVQVASSTASSSAVFGTKRYARSNLIPSGDYGSQVGGLPLPPVYHLPSAARYYDTQVPPQYFPYAPYQAPSSDYYDDSGYYGDAAKSYYYMPQPQHRRYQRNNERYTSYGMPTYRGEYKPTPYYYAPGPSYSYSDDHESSNPLDDLHEEMLQEDERERARDYYPVGQEQWYESPTRPDSAFLRNLILYNQQLQAFSNGRGKPQLPPLDMSNEEDFEEYDDPEADYEYDLPLPTDSRGNYDSYYGTAGGYPSDLSYGGSPDNRNAFSKLNSFRNSMAKNQIDEEDEEVQELKSLIHQQKQNSQRLPPLLYDDSWSHWDRKRNVQPKKATFAGKTTTPRSVLKTSTTKKTTTTTKKPAHSGTSTTVTPAPTDKQAAPKPGSGQKEVVLPRPTNPRNLFAATLINAVDESRAQQAAANKAEENANKLKQAKSNKIYDTIKAMINMRQNIEDAELRQQLEQQKQLAHIHKRFVANEESLVQELDGLKRSA